MARSQAFLLASAVCHGPVLAQEFEDLAPCLEQRADAAAYVAAFEEAGWSPAPDEATRVRALRASGEVETALKTFVRAFRDSRDVTEFLESAWRWGEANDENSEVLTKEEMNVDFEFRRLDDGIGVYCVITGRSLEMVADWLAAIDIEQSESLAFSYTPSPDGNFREFGPEWEFMAVRIDYRHLSQQVPSGGDGLFISAKLPLDAEPAQ